LEVVGMNEEQLFPHQRFDAYKAARSMAKATFDAKIRDRELRDQAQRAACSVFLQLSEGLPCDQPAMRANYFGRARDSLFELVAAIDLAQLVGACDAAKASEVTAHALRVRAMLVALLRVRR
jgi:four helix bundle protein